MTNFCLADCGIIYVFVCFDCYKATSFIHSYNARLRTDGMGGGDFGGPTG